MSINICVSSPRGNAPSLLYVHHYYYHYLIMKDVRRVFGLGWKVSDTSVGLQAFVINVCVCVQVSGVSWRCRC